MIVEVEDTPVNSMENLVLPNEVPYVVEEITGSDRLIYDDVSNKGKNINSHVIHSVSDDIGSNGSTLAPNSQINVTKDVPDSPIEFQNSEEVSATDVVPDSVVGSDTISGKELLTPEHHPNQVVTKDMRIVGRLWSDDTDMDDIEENIVENTPVSMEEHGNAGDNFTLVVSKNRKKKMKKKNKQNQKSGGCRA